MSALLLLSLFFVSILVGCGQKRAAQDDARRPMQDVNATHNDSAQADVSVPIGRVEAPDSVFAAGVLDAYYEAINQKDYSRAYALWGSNGEASGKTLAQFSAGFDQTASVRVTAGPAGTIGAAAGSRYIDIPVTIDARLLDGTKQHFTGTYTLRRSVVDGATAEQRAWRIYKAHIVASR